MIIYKGLIFVFMLKYNLVLLLVVCLLFFSCGSGEAPEDAKAMGKMLNEFSQEQYKKNGLRFSGITESGTRDGYRMIGVHFDSIKLLSKDKGRKLIVNSNDELLDKINNTDYLQPFLLEKPFTGKHLRFKIFVQSWNENEPTLSVFSLYNGVVTYKYDNKDNNFGYIMTEKESLEEARRLIKESEHSND